MSDRPMSSRLLAEGVGTFALVFIGPGAAAVDAWSGGKVGHVGVALSFALVVFAVVAALGRISGAHLNPAVTVGPWSLGRFPARGVLPYVGAQLAAGVLAAFALRGLLGSSVGAVATHPVIGTLSTLCVEFLLTGFLMIVVLGTATDSRAEGPLAGLVIGCAVGFDAMMGGPLTGASMNPARSFGPALAAGVWTAHWGYWLGPMLGALAGARLHDLMHRSVQT